MKKITKLILVCLLALGMIAASPVRENVQAEGTIANLKADANGVVTWNAYPGAIEYDIYIDDEFINTVTSPSINVKEYLMDWCAANGTYTVTVTAWQYSDEWYLIADGSVNYSYTAPNGTLAAPAKAWWDGTDAHWDPVPNAERYFIDIYCNGELVDSTIAWGDNMAYLYYYTAGRHNVYSFGVSAAGYGYSRSPYVYSGNINGHDPRVDRLSGKNRYDTSLQVAQYFVDSLGGPGSVYSAVIATGKDFPDALSGSYLANMMQAPLILISKNSAADVCQFIKDNINHNGQIYILGGTGAVPDEWIAPLFADFANVSRIAGKNRYQTNLDILRTAGVSHYQEILVCTGKGFADSLSASSVRDPILLVGSSLTAEQKQFLSTEARNCTFIIIGGAGAVSEAVEADLNNYGYVYDRIAGKNRYETSYLVADYFFGHYSKEVILATGKDFPDGLSGGPLGYLFNAPILLVSPKDNSNAAKYAAENRVSIATVLGGEGAVSTAAVNVILGLTQ